MRDTSPDRMAHIALEDHRWLTSAEGAAALELAAGLSGELTSKLRRLLAQMSADRAYLVIEHLELRQRAREKFSRAESMFFTRKGLEQATDERVAAHKAARFAGRKHVVDLCAGIGGDLLALAAVCPTVGVDRDPVSAHYAAANAGVVLSAENACSMRTQDVLETDLSTFDAWHIDPDRRSQGSRTTRVEYGEPPDDVIDRLLAGHPNAAIKLAPAAVVPAAWQEQSELEWISRGRQCRQLVAWFGELAQFPGQRRATVLTNHNGEPSSIVGEPGDDVPVAARIGRYLFEPDAAVLAADLSRCVAMSFRLEAVAPGIAYWTGDELVDGDYLLSAFEVVEVLPLDLKKVKQALVARDVGTLEIKVRRVEENPAELRRKLRLTGSQSATLLITRIERRVIAIIARRVERESWMK